ncbi:MAG TPA: DNA repair protein RecN [Clostridiales bacterium]|nr:DNA repair protein RecN [Clostridiales bacterium]
MLAHLHIENIAVIEKADIEFINGFNVLTGETGAGKSIIIDSINAIIGERTSRELIRTGCDRAVVSAVFVDLNSAAVEKLNELGFAPDDEGNLLVQRIINSDGKSVARINGMPATVTVLRELGRTLINIHGQHDSQSLLDPSTHYKYLDLISENGSVLHNYREAFEGFKKVRKAFQQTEMDESEKARLLDLLNFQISELEAANIRLGEYEELKSKRDFLQNYEKVAMLISRVGQYLSGDEDTQGAVSLVKLAGDDMAEIAEILGEAKGLAERLATLGYELEEAAEDLRVLADNIEYNPQELERIENRLDLLGRLMLKYGGSEQEMLAFLEDCKRKRDDIVFNEQRRQQLEKELEQAKLKLISCGNALTESRKDAAAEFSKAVCAALEFLDMSGVKFKAEIKKAPYSATGADEIEFLISTNPGEPPKSLAKIASGGELSRIMLAIKSVLAGKDDVDTLIFDEIDTGISGHAAGQVGIKLKNLSKDKQVICVTHLAQIAAMADCHLLIEKSVNQGRTFTTVRRIEGEEQIKEISRIISGGEITESIRNTAREMIESNR